jgi:hypothetical protein
VKKSAALVSSVIVLLLLLPCGAAGADDARLGKKITLNLKEASTRDLFGIYEGILGVKVDYACAEDKKVTFAFENVSARTSLDAICESAGLQWKILDGDPPTLRIDCALAPAAAGIAPVTEPKSAGGPAERAGKMKVYTPKSAGGDHPPYKIDVTLEGADLDKVLSMMAKLLNAKLLVDQSLAGRKVTLDMKRASLEEVLDAACAQANARWQLKGGDEPLLTVDPVR